MPESDGDMSQMMNTLSAWKSRCRFKRDLDIDCRSIPTNMLELHMLCKLRTSQVEGHVNLIGTQRAKGRA
eukprot:4958532-Amphidinium_carterae.1